MLVCKQNMEEYTTRIVLMGFIFIARYRYIMPSGISGVETICMRKLSVADFCHEYEINETIHRILEDEGGRSPRDFGRRSQCKAQNWSNW